MSLIDLVWVESWYSIRKRLYAGTVPASKEYAAGKVPAIKKYAAGSVPENRDYTEGTPKIVANSYDIYCARLG